MCLLVKAKFPTLATIIVFLQLDYELFIFSSLQCHAFFQLSTIDILLFFYYEKK